MSNIDSDSDVVDKALAEPEMGDLLVAYLNQLGVEYVFGVPGGAIEPLYNALARSERQGGVRAVVARHETGAAFMADGYARNTGKLGVCCSTTGPGATNMITGVASAYENNVPMLAITAQTAISTFGKGAIQDSSCTGINTVGLYQHCTRYNTLISHPAQFEHKLSAAIMSAMGSPAGPAHISVPRDVMALPSINRGVNYQLHELLDRPALIDSAAVKQLYRELAEAKKVVFIIGDEACDAIGSILSLAVEMKADIVVTPQGKGLVSPYHPQFKGVFGFAGHLSAKAALTNPEVDLVLAAGARFGEFSSNAWDTKTLLNGKLVHVESTEANLTRTPMARLHVRGCLATIFDHIVDKFGIDCSHYVRAVNPRNVKIDIGARHFEFDDEKSYRSSATPIKPQRVMRDLQKLFPGNTRFLVDTGNSLAWGTHYLHPYDRRMSGKRTDRGGLFSASVDFASMGWAIGSAIGTALADQKRVVVCITGDGSWLMSGQELTVAIEEKLKVVFVIMNDSASNFGAYDLVKYSKELEDRATANNIEHAADYARRISQAFDAVSIDLQQETSLIDQMDRVSVSPQKQSYRILVVDDDRSIRLLLVNAFRREEYELDEAGNGAEAIEVCQRRMPDLILMDAVMPEMDGFDACKAIRETPHGADIPVLMITGLEDENSIVRAFSSGATDYISKPINFSVMKQRVARLIKANKAEKHVKQLAYHDPLTSLPNRANLMQHLRLVVEQAAAENSKFAILFLDLDRFKMINDTMGHDVGDLLLKAVADRIRNCVRDQDFIARLGGDEFTLVLENITGAETAAKVAEKICQSLNQPFVFMRKKMFVTTSIGISIFPDNGGDVTDLIKHADSAMFKAKEKRNDYCFYETGMEAEIAERLEMERELRQAIERDELVLFYQPKIDFKTGALTGAEALVRWEHPDEGVIAPNVFIPLAEESGLINKLSDWVLEEGARQLRRWIDTGHELTLALNLSVKDLMTEDLHSQLESLMERNQLPPGVLEIEITESTLMSHPELMSTELVKIKDLGISVAIDDFGSGYSSLNYLKRLPVDVLKIDRAFIQDIETDPSDSAIVAGIIALAETLNMETVAEGVETEGQRTILNKLGCNSFQGYLVAKPQPAEQFEQEFLIKRETSLQDDH